MKPNLIREKSIEFAIKTYELCEFIEKRKLYEISKQLKRSGTSIGAQIFESENAESKAYFIHKLSISQKEANETLYWIELLKRLLIDVPIILNEYEEKAIEIKKILTSILKNLKSTQNNP